MRKFYFLYLIAFFLFSCNKGNDCLTSLGEIKTVYRNVSMFDKIKVENRIHLDLIQDASKAGLVEISGPANLLDQITTDVQEGWLKLDNGNTCNFVRSFDYEIRVTVYLLDLKTLYTDGVATVSTLDTLFVDKLDIEHIALSDVNLTLSCDEIFVRSRNSAFTGLKGICRVLKGSIEEISDLNAEALIADEVILDTHSSQNCYVNATKGLYVRFYSNGDIYYIEEPSDYKIIDIQKSTGTLKKKQ